MQRVSPRRVAHLPQTRHVPRQQEQVQVVHWRCNTFLGQTKLIAAAAARSYLRQKAEVCARITIALVIRLASNGSKQAVK